MIRRIRSRALRALYVNSDASRVDPRHLRRLNQILLHLGRAQSPHYMNLPGLGLHALTGDLAGYYAVRVSGNWRVTFRFEDGDATDIDYVDYH